MQTLICLLGDMEFDIRIDALALLGRLAGHNSAHLLAPLRNVLKHIVVELKFGKDDVMKEQSTRMLCTLLMAPALQTLVHPYIRRVIEILPLKVSFFCSYYFCLFFVALLCVRFLCVCFLCVFFRVFFVCVFSRFFVFFFFVCFCFFRWGSPGSPHAWQPCRRLCTLTCGGEGHRDCAAQGSFCVFFFRF